MLYFFGPLHLSDSCSYSSLWPHKASSGLAWAPCRVSNMWLDSSSTKVWNKLEKSPKNNNKQKKKSDLCIFFPLLLIISCLLRFILWPFRGNQNLGSEPIKSLKLMLHNATIWICHLLSNVQRLIFYKRVLLPPMFQVYLAEVDFWLQDLTQHFYLSKSESSLPPSIVTYCK